MPFVFRLPDLGEGLTEAEIVAWHVAAGDHVVADQPLVSIETDKAVVEVPSPRSGHVAAVHGAPGEIVRVGAPLVEFADGAAQDRGAIVGDVFEEPGPAPPGDRRDRRDRGVRAAPAVRRLAAACGIDLAAIAGTGAGGSITRADVEAAAGRAAGAGSTTGSGGGASEPLRGVRRAMFNNMSRAGRQVVPATLNDDADVQAWPPGTDASVRLICAVVAACRAVPSLNVWFDAASGSRIVHAQVDLGIALETDAGLFAPVLHSADGLSAAQLRQRLEEIKRGAAARTLARDELAEPTITLSNFGMFGGRYASLVVVPPQVAIVGAGRIEASVVARAGAAVVRRVLPLSLTFDHRVVTGVEATRFLAALIADLERADARGEQR